VTRAQVLPTSTAAGSGSTRGRLTFTSVSLLAALSLALAACGGGDDDEAETTTLPTNPATFATNPPTLPPTLAPTVPLTAAPTPVQYVTEGASVMVTNASRVDGGAGRLSERLAAVGFTTVAPGNYALGKLEVSIIYYDPANPAARAVADSLKAAFGGGDIQVVELPVPPPVDTGDALGAGVLVAMGNDIADKTLDELQGITPPATTAPPATSGAPSSSAPSTTGA
jgi:LytR cell envelope-related transcriptional attenuator